MTGLVIRKRNPGRPEDLERGAWREYLGATRSSAKRWPDLFLNQLCHCRTDEARRLLVRAMEASATVRRDRHWHDYPDARINQQRLKLSKMMGLQLKDTVMRHLTPAEIDQLLACKTQAARRLILGISH